MNRQSRAVVILSPDCPPRTGGVADHTAGLAEVLSAKNEVTVLTSADAGGESGGAWRKLGRIKRWGDIGEIRAGIAGTRPDATLVWQYVPHMYGRGGANPGLPGLWRELKAAGRKQLFMVHEIAADLSWRPARLWYALNHRRQWGALRATADGLGISTEAWLLRWRPGNSGGDRWFLAPSPSNITPLPRPAGHRVAWREAMGLTADTRVILHFGAHHAHKQPEHVVRAWREAAAGGPAPVAVVMIGSKWKPPLEPGEDRWFLALGYLPAEEVGAALAACDVLAMPFFDGVSERRTSLMAGLAHGAPVVGTVGSNTGPSLRAAKFLWTSPATDAIGFARLVATLLADEPRRRAVGDDGRAAYELDYSWSVVASRLQALLDQRMGS